jgi:hypothetical protein
MRPVVHISMMSVSTVAPGKIIGNTIQERVRLNVVFWIAAIRQKWGLM